MTDLFVESLSLPLERPWKNKFGNYLPSCCSEHNLY